MLKKTLNISSFGVYQMPRARPHVIIARLDDSELQDFNYLLHSTGPEWYLNKSRAFRKVLKLATDLLRERRAKEGRIRLTYYFSEKI
jgi:hypothetical protein